MDHVLKRRWATWCRCGKWARVMCLELPQQHAVQHSVPHHILVSPSLVPVNWSFCLIPDFPVMFWSFASFSFWLCANLREPHRKKSYTFAVPCPKPWVFLSARCAILFCLLIFIFLFTIQNMPTCCLGAACQAGEMTPGAMSTPSKVLFWDQASAQVIQQSFILLT